MVLKQVLDSNLSLKCAVITSIFINFKLDLHIGGTKGEVEGCETVMWTWDGINGL